MGKQYYCKVGLHCWGTESLKTIEKLCEIHERHLDYIDDTKTKVSSEWVPTAPADAMAETKVPAEKGLGKLGGMGLVDLIAETKVPAEKGPAGEGPGKLGGMGLVDLIAEIKVPAEKGLGGMGAGTSGSL